MTDKRWETLREIVYRGAIIVLGGLCATYLAFVLHFRDSSVGFLYLLLVVIVALRLGFGAATAASLSAVICLDFFFIPPVFSLRISDPVDWFALVTFELTALVVSRLSTQVQLQARMARRRSSDRHKLYQLTRGVLLLDPARPASSQVLALIQATMQTESSALFDETQARTYSVGVMTAELEATARHTFLQNREANDAVNGTWSRVLTLGENPVGAIALRSKELHPEVVDAVGSVAAIAIERARSLDRAARAETAKHSEQLRTTVLDSLAHAFKTPLTTIIAASSGLLEGESLRGIELELVTLIDQEAERLNNLATQLLRTARLYQGPIRPTENCDLREITNRILKDLSWELTGRPVITRIPGPVLSVLGDRELICMGIAQLVDNAAKYSTPGSVITVAAERQESETVLTVHNHGPVIATKDRERIFERFYRGKGSEHLAAGTGIGLSVTKRAAEAHGGKAWVDSDEVRGTTFYFSLPHVRMRAVAALDGIPVGSDHLLRGEKV